MFKINIATKQGNTFKLEAEAPALIEKELHSKVQGKDISPELEGYEFEITGASDKSGFTAMKDVEGIGLKKVLLTYGKAMSKKPRKEGKKKITRNKPKGLRLRKTVRGKIVSEAISQINLKILKQGVKKLEEIFPDQNKVAEPEAKVEEAKPEDKPQQKITKSEEQPKQEQEEKIKENPKPQPE